jgi:transcriptional regulator with XRE-family HTH domain
MELHERIALIIKENNLKQKELAAIIGVTESYISALLRKRHINPSQSFANLIEEKLGYDAHWVLTGEGQKLKPVSKNASLSDVHKKAIIQLEKMPVEQIKAVLAFINSLEEVERRFNTPSEVLRDSGQPREALSDRRTPPPGALPDSAGD